MLDAIIDALMNDEPVTLHVVDEPAARGCRSPHGTRERYCNGGCRCDRCRAAATHAQRELRYRQRLTELERGNQ